MSLLLFCFHSSCISILVNFSPLSSISLVHAPPPSPLALPEFLSSYFLVYRRRSRTIPLHSFSLPPISLSCNPSIALSLSLSLCLCDDPFPSHDLRPGRLFKHETRGRGHVMNRKPKRPKRQRLCERASEAKRNRNGQLRGALHPPHPMDPGLIPRHGHFRRRHCSLLGPQERLPCGVSLVLLRVLGPEEGQELDPEGRVGEGLMR